MTVIYCFHCQAAIAAVEEDGDWGPTVLGQKLHMLGGYSLLACKRCGAIQLPEARLEEARSNRQKRKR
jgi:hypothetical protein